MRLHDISLHQMLQIDFDIVQYEVYENSRDFFVFLIAFIHLKLIFQLIFGKNVKLFLSFFDKNLNNNFTSVDSGSRVL
jgi:hypothetical protein